MERINGSRTVLAVLGWKYKTINSMLNSAKVNPVDRENLCMYVCMYACMYVWLCVCVCVVGGEGGVGG